MIYDKQKKEDIITHWNEAKKYEDLPDRIPKPDQIFVFGSNIPGLHGKGAAKFAVQHYGAVYGQGEGLQGRSYALPTKRRWNQALTLAEVKRSVTRFVKFAQDHPELQFFVTRVGCGLAGFTDEYIAPMFVDAPLNCDLPWGWRDYNFNLKEL